MKRLSKRGRGGVGGGKRGQVKRLEWMGEGAHDGQMSEGAGGGGGGGCNPVIISIELWTNEAIYMGALMHRKLGLAN